MHRVDVCHELPLPSRRIRLKPPKHVLSCLSKLMQVGIICHSDAPITFMWPRRFDQFS
jgi:hypothetical protein